MRDGFQKPEQEGHEGNEGHEEVSEGTQGFRAPDLKNAKDSQRQPMEKAPGFEIGAVISESRSPFHQFAVQPEWTESGMFSAPFMSFVHFMLFLFRPLESLPTSGVPDVTPIVL